ncbi:MAG: hypothetical protein B6U73_00490 [Desulfurococcales archaeon ex4484_204]|nr:MAG: hypothetical protein B6U73_00490 [Desulfurococcales archaeon ex4484_204]
MNKEGVLKLGLCEMIKYSIAGMGMRSPLDVLKEANRRKRSAKIKTPLVLIRSLNKERRRIVATQRILERVVGR